MYSGMDKKSFSTRTDTCQPACGCRGDRREFLQLLGATGIGLLSANLHAVAGPFDAGEFDKLVPADKKFRPEWLESLTARGEPERYSGEELRFIGMPVGGIFSGMLYLGGDGRLWLWNIFNRDTEGVVAKQIEYAGARLGSRDGALFVSPPEQTSPVEQGFSLRFTSANGEKSIPLDRRGFRDITFTGQYPIGEIEYRDPDAPLTAKLVAFSPFIPLNVDDSSIPATILEFTLTNSSAATVSATLTGWLENAVCLHHRDQAGVRRNRVEQETWGTAIVSTVEPPPHANGDRADLLFEDWRRDDYHGWTVEGEAFGKGPIDKFAMPSYQGDVGGTGQRVVNSHATAPGDGIEKKDAAVGKLTSRPFIIERGFIHVWIGGGAHRDRTCVNLLVDGQKVGSLTGRGNNRLELRSFSVTQWAGKSAMLEIVDAESGSWGNVGVGTITQSDKPTQKLEELFDHGSMSLALLGKPADRGAANAQFLESGVAHLAQATVPNATLPIAERLVGALERDVTLGPGESTTITFVVAWHFPNLIIGPNLKGRSYAARFDSAKSVCGYLAANFARLANETRLWRDTWHDSTLPYWFLNRTFANTSILATTTCYRVRDGRFWAWEGVGCCPGTCTHVWHYAQAMGRIFPEIERDQRERVDFGLALAPETGVIKVRAEDLDIFAVDGQCGTILRAYREHQVSADDRFLRRIWPQVKRAVQCLLDRDREKTGVLYGPMHNTLDADWFGVVPWLVGMFHAALRAAELMALEMSDDAFANKCRDIFNRGVDELDRMTFSAQHNYYIHLSDPNHQTEVGSYDGCHIDQVLGQAWAWQIGLGPVMKNDHVRAALESLWRYNVTPDVGPFRAANKPGRWYAMPGDGGLLMVTFPFGRPPQVTGAGAWSAMYFNECMSGFEWQVAAHMLWEGMVTEGLAVSRLIHDRYHARFRNPYNEVECSDHYARAMASYGAYLAACGFEYHGPKRHIGIAPRIGADDFRAAFTAAEGWGTIAQRRDSAGTTLTISPRWGQLKVQSISLEWPNDKKASGVIVRAGEKIDSSISQTGRRVVVRLAGEVLLRAGQTLELVVS